MIDFIFENIIFFIIIGFAIVRFLSELFKGNEANSGNKSETTTNKKSSGPLSDIFGDIKEVIEEVSQGDPKKAENTQNTAAHDNEIHRTNKNQQVRRQQKSQNLDADELHSEQLARFKKQYATSSTELEKAQKKLEKYSEVPQVVKSSSKNSHLDMKNRLTNEGLKESVVMMEVLGPPRAMKPYRGGSYKNR